MKQGENIRKKVHLSRPWDPIFSSQPMLKLNKAAYNLNPFHMINYGLIQCSQSTLCDWQNDDASLISSVLWEGNTPFQKGNQI